MDTKTKGCDDMALFENINKLLAPKTVAAQQYNAPVSNVYSGAMGIYQRHPYSSGTGTKPPAATTPKVQGYYVQNKAQPYGLDLEALLRSMQGGGGGGHAATPFNMPSWEPPQVPMLSLDEMMDIINRRVGLMINPQVEGLRRGIEEERGAHERRVGETKEGYEEARGQLQKMGEQQQREGASSMRKRGLYDSGLAMDLANRIQRQVGEHGLKLENEQARVLADLAEYLSTRERHTEEQIQGLEGRRGEWSQSLLEEMERQERDRRDRLEQQAFENWLSQTAMEQQIWQANQAAQAQAARASAATPKTPGFNDILQQMQMQALLTMPQRQREEYVLGTLPGTVDDFWEQLRKSQWGTLTPEKQREYLYGLGTISGLY